MLAKLNSWLRAFFTLNKSEQRGIIVLVILIVLVGLLNLLLPVLIPESKPDFSIHQKKIDDFLNEQKRLSDSVENNKVNSDDIDHEAAVNKLAPFIFNPNKLPVEEWEKMGFTMDQIRTIKNYEEKGGSFKRKEDLKKIYTISDQEYRIIEPFIVIPVSKNTSTRKQVELNSTNATELINSLLLSSKLAERTIKFRNLLGGFYKKEQLREVYGISNDIYEDVKDYLTIDPDLIKKLNINEIEFKGLMAHPYFDYQLAKSIFDVRNQIGKFDQLDQLKHIDGISDSTYAKVSYYLYIRPEKTK